MSCPGHRRLCDVTRRAGDNIHRCWLDHCHTGRHVCACRHSWPAEDAT